MKGIARATIYGDPFIGLYARTNDEITIVSNIPEKFAMALAQLKTVLIKTPIADSILTGLYVVMNNNGIVVPQFISNEEIAKLKETKLNVTKIKSKLCALGNNIVANNHAAIANPRFERAAIKQIEDALGVEVIKMTLAGFATPGTVVLATSRGFVAHPATKEEELRRLSEILKVDGGIATANCGVPFPAISVIANSNGLVVGEQTTGWELGRLRECLNLA